MPTNLHYKGSAMTFEMVKNQIKERWGEAEAELYTPDICLPFRAWVKAGYRIRKGEKAIKSVTFIPMENEEGQELRKIPKTVNLFYILQVEKIEN